MEIKLPVARLGQATRPTHVPAQRHVGAHIHDRSCVQADGTAPDFAKTVGAFQGTATQNQTVGQVALIGPQGGATAHRDRSAAKGCTTLAGGTAKQRAA